MHWIELVDMCVLRIVCWQSLNCKAFVIVGVADQEGERRKKEECWVGDDGDNDE